MKWSLPQFAIILALALAAYLSPSIVGGKVLMPLDRMSHERPFEHAEGDTTVHNGLLGDMLWENLAWKTFQRECMLKGELPLWNPYSFCGHPLYATGQASTFYPFNLILVLIPLPYGYVVFTWLHLFAGGVFMYLFLKRIGVGGFGASVGGTAFAMCAYFAVRFIWPMLLGSAIWLPLMLLWIDWMSDRRCLNSVLKGLLTGAVLFAMPLLSGFFEIAFYVFCACGLYTLTMGLRVMWRERSLLDGLRFFAKVGVATGLAVAVAAPQMLPFFEVAKLNVRAGEMSYESARGKAITWPEVLTFAVPEALGNPSVHKQFDVNSRSWQPIKIKDGPDFFYFGPQNYVESTNYVGLLSLAFAMLACATGGWRRSTIWLTIAALLVVVAATPVYATLARAIPGGEQNAGDLRLGLVLLAVVAMAMGAGGQRRVFIALLLGISLALAFVTPVYSVLFKLVPGMDQVRSPWRWTLVTMFGCACLAGVGADYWFNQLSAPTRRLTRVVATMKWLVALLLVVVVAALLFMPAKMGGVADRLLEACTRAKGTFNNPQECVNLLWMNAARFAVVAFAATTVIALAYWRKWNGVGVSVISLVALLLVAADLGHLTYDFNTHSDPSILHQKPPILQKLQEAAATEQPFRIGRYSWQNTFHPNSPTFYGLQDFGGYDSVILRSFAQYMQAIETQHFLPYNFILQVRGADLLSSPMVQLLGLRYLVSVDKLKNTDYEQLDVPGNMRLYQLKPDKGMPRAFLVSRVERVGELEEAIEAIKGQRIDIREQAVVETIPGGTSGLVDPMVSPPGKATIVDYRSSRVRVETDTPSRQLLVLCDVEYPGWRAYVDGFAVGILKTDGIFRGVSVPAGQHTVEFRFEPPLLRLGIMLSLGTLVALIVLGIARRMLNREPPESYVPRG